MPRDRITNTLLQAAKPRDREYFLWDNRVPGFGARVSPKGNISFVYQYRLDGKTQRRKLGRFGDRPGDVAAEEARKAAKAFDVDVDRGLVVVESRDTVAELASRYMDKHAWPKKPKTARQDELNINRHILPALGKKRVSKVTYRDVEDLHDSLRPTPYMANRVHALLSMMFRLAEKWEMRPRGTNPCRGIERCKEKPRERFLSTAEMERLGTTLREMSEDGTAMPSQVAAIRLLIFTGCRRNEVGKLRWDEVDLENRELRLQDSKTGPKVVPLNIAAVEVLRGLDERGPYVFAGKKDNRPISMDPAWRRIRERAELADVRLHDVRHHYASTGTGTGLSLFSVGKLLGHKDAATTQRYAHAQRDPLLQATEQIGSRLTAELNGAKPAEVVELEERRARS